MGRKRILGVPLLASTTVLLVLLSAPFVVPLFHPWSTINCKRQEIDILTGLRRDTRFLYGVPISRKFQTTVLAPEIAATSIQNARWKVVNTFDLYTKHSPHHAYHSAFSQMHTLGLIWEDKSFDAARRKDSASALLHAWQASYNDNIAERYIRKLVDGGE